MGSRYSRRVSRSIYRFLQSKARGLEVKRGDFQEGDRARFEGRDKKNETSNRKLIYSLQFQFTFKEGLSLNADAEQNPHKCWVCT
jgi:hypothetical protein